MAHITCIYVCDVINILYVYEQFQLHNWYKDATTLCTTVKKKLEVDIQNHGIYVPHMYAFVCGKNIHFKQGSLEILKRKECYRPKYSQFQDTGIYMQ